VLARVEQPAGIGLLPDPRHELMREPPQRHHAFLGLLAQPLPDPRLIGELAHPQPLAGQPIVIERLAVGQTAAAGTQRVKELADQDLRAVAAPLVLARIQAGELAQLAPKVEAPGHGLDGDQPRVNGVVEVRTRDLGLDLPPLAGSDLRRNEWGVDGLGRLRAKKAKVGSFPLPKASVAGYPALLLWWLLAREKEITDRHERKRAEDEERQYENVAFGAEVNEVEEIEK